MMDLAVLARSLRRATLLALIAALAGCDALSTPPPAELPWVRGFTPAAVTSQPAMRATQRLSEIAAASAMEDFGALEVRADLDGDARPERVLVSYALGIAVVDDRDRVVGRAPGFEPGGSADDLLAISVGDGQLTLPLLIVATQTGGHRVSATTLSLYRLRGGALQPVFAEPIETHDGKQTRSGSLLFVRDALWYRAPDAEVAARWRFDAYQARYVEAQPGDPPTS